MRNVSERSEIDRSYEIEPNVSCKVTFVKYINILIFYRCYLFNIPIHGSDDS
jgi:hypothetical protein